MNASVHTPQSLLQLAYQAILDGKPEQAENLARPLLGNAGVFAEALHVLGLSFASRSNHRIAEAWFEQAAAVVPSHPTYWMNLAQARDNQKLGAEANEAWLRCALAYYHLRQLHESLPILEKILQRDAGFMPAYVDAAAVLEELHRPAESMRHAVMLLKALRDQVPGLPEFLDALPGDLRKISAAPLNYKAPDVSLVTAQTLNNLGNAALKQPDFELSERAYRLSHTLAPTQALVTWNLSMLVLGRGEFEEGWKLYETRWARPDWEFPDRQFTQPAWTGEPLTGKTVLVYCEQGFGDSIQFSVLAQRLVDQGARVILEVQPELLWLLRQSFETPNLMVVPRLEDPRRVYGDPRFDFHVSALSLPHRLNLKMGDLPAAKNYLRADESAVQKWKKQLPDTRNRRVGIVWAGRPQHRNDAQRSVPFAQLKPLWDLADIEWHSLQVGSAAEAELQTAALSQVKNWAPQLGTFAETAALIANLDLVIAVDTAVAHLAAAMGKPVWLLVAHPAEWRWMRDRDDSPWYPSLRIFRQATPGEWAPVVERVAKALRRRDL